MEGLEEYWVKVVHVKEKEVVKEMKRLDREVREILELEGQKVVEGER